MPALNISKCFNTYSLEVNLFQVLNESLLICVKKLDFFDVFGARNLVVFGSLYKGVVMAHVRTETTLDRVPPREIWDFAHSICQSLQVVTSQELLVEVVVNFTATFLHNWVKIAIHPEWEVGVEVIVVSIKANIFSEVGDFVVIIEVGGVVRVV